MYAGSPDTYKTFAPLFDPLIQKYHGKMKEVEHTSNMDYTKLKIPGFRGHEDEMIISTRIRVARNLEGYPLGGKMTREQRLEVEQKIIEACSTFSGDLAGTYYSLATMSEEDR